VGDPSLIIGSIGTAVTGAIGAWAILTGARAKAGRPRQVLRRLWDWLELSGHRAELSDRNPSLHDDVVSVLDDDKEQ